MKYSILAIETWTNHSMAKNLPKVTFSFLVLLEMAKNSPKSTSSTVSFYLFSVWSYYLPSLENRTTCLHSITSDQKKCWTWNSQSNIVYELILNVNELRINVTTALISVTHWQWNRFEISIKRSKLNSLYFWMKHDSLIKSRFESIWIRIDLNFNSFSASVICCSKF